MKPDELQHYGIFRVQNALKLRVRVGNIINFFDNYTRESRLKVELNGHGDGHGLEEGEGKSWREFVFGLYEEKEESALANSIS